jgi:hypothetical protein
MRCASLANADTSASPPEAAPKCGGGPDIGRSGALSARHPAHAVGAEVEAAPAVHAQFPRRRPLGPTQRGALAASLDVRIGEVQDHCDRRRHESPADHLPFGGSRRSVLWLEQCTSQTTLQPDGAGAPQSSFGWCHLVEPRSAEPSAAQDLLRDCRRRGQIARAYLRRPSNPQQRDWVNA